MVTKFSRKFLVLIIFLMGIHVTMAQTVTGTVTDDTGPLPGANVIIKGTSTGTTTDFDGNYTINASGTDVLVFSYIGYQATEILVGNQQVINVTLAEDTNILDEVVIIGLGQTQNKRTVSTAVATVSSEDIVELSITRPEAALQGTIPGVIVAQNSGSPGSPLSVRVRGVSTPNNSEPLYLVDGFQVPNLQHLNAGDIGSINILKDAAATSVYGARGGAGVVLVETKKGTRNMDRFRASIEGYYGFQRVRRDSDLMNRDEYLFFYKSALQYANTFGEQYRPAVFNTIGEVTANQNILPDTDWLDLIFQDDAPIQNLHASVSDGGEKYSWGISAGLFEQGGIVGGPDKSNFERNNVHVNFDFDILENLKFTANGDLVRMDENIVLENQNSETQGIGIVTAANAAAPIYVPYSPTGTIFNPSFGTRGDNALSQVTSNGVLLNSMNIYTSPLFMLASADQNQKSDVYQFGTNLQWKVLDNLKVSGSYSRFSRDDDFKSFQFDFIGTPIDTEQNFFLPASNILNLNKFTREIDNFDANAEYTFDNLGNHNLQVIGGTSYQRDKGTADFRQGTNLSVNTFGEAELSLAETVQILDPADQTNGFTTRINESKLFSLYARAMYDFNQKYLLTASLRADTSSKFGPENETGYFPAFSAGWVISEENFLRESDVISLLKLRGSWGVNGIDNIREDEFNDAFDESGRRVRLANPDIKWEEIEQTNIGLDINAFDNRLGVTLDYYKKTTDGILIELQPILSSGASGETFQNVGGVTNEGFEALVSFRNFPSDDGAFKYNISANIGFNDNTFDGSGIPENTITGGNLRQFATPVTNTLNGHPIAAFFGYEVDFINNRGELVFKDLDGDGVVNVVNSDGSSVPDLDDRTIIGNPYPDITYGVAIGASYKGFDLNANLTGAHGNDIFDARYNSAVPFSNRPVEYLSNGLRPVLSGLAGSQSEVSDFFIKDGSYAKLKNVTLGYNFQKVAENIGLTKMRFYIQGQNLWTITDYDGGDPEIGQSSNNPNATLDVGIDRGFYPQPTTFLFGFQFQY